MKTIKTILVLACLLIVSNLFAQEKTTVTETNTEKSNTKINEWQFSLRGGYDFPSYDTNFKYIDHDGGIMGGASIAHFWKWFGLQSDFDYIQNTPNGTLKSMTVRDFTSTTGFTDVNIDYQKKSITRMFVGIGPAFKFDTKNRKFSLNAAALAGLGTVSGGEILGTFTDPIKDTRKMASYHSGFDHQGFAVKGSLQANYWFNENWGLFAGAYYMNHFKIDEATANALYQDAFGPNPAGAALYYSEPQFIKADSPVGIDGGNVFEATKDRVKFNGDDMKRSIALQSVGAYAGIIYRLPTTVNSLKKEKTRIIKKEVIKEQTIGKYNLMVTAKDKFSGQVLADTDVVLKNAKNEVVASGKTNGFGMVSFPDIMADNYTVEGILNEINLESTTIAEKEFKVNEVLQKEIQYTDRNFIVKGKAVECNTTTALSGISVILENKAIAFKKTSITDNKGEFLMQLPEQGTYSLYGKKDSYFSQIEEVTASNYDRNKTLFVKLEICAEKVDCGKAIGLKNILFDLAKYNIKEEAKVELNKLVGFMLDNPDVTVEVGSHTDSRASSAYNQTLSQNRANSSIDYIVSQGVSRSRITARGYGETQLLNQCADGQNCTEQEHALNRRTEFKVICPPTTN